MEKYENYTSICFRTHHNIPEWIWMLDQPRLLSLYNRLLILRSPLDLAGNPLQPLVKPGEKNISVGLSKVWKTTSVGPSRRCKSGDSPLSGEAAAGLYLPLVLPQVLQTQLLRDLRGAHAACHVLLVSEDEDRSLVELVALKHSVQLLLWDRYPLSVCAVYHLWDRDLVIIINININSLSKPSFDYQDNELCVWVVSVPCSPKRLLPAQVPHHKVDIVPDNLWIQDDSNHTQDQGNQKRQASTVNNLLNTWLA